MSPEPVDVAGLEVGVQPGVVLAVAEVLEELCDQLLHPHLALDGGDVVVLDCLPQLLELPGDAVQHTQPIAHLLEGDVQLLVPVVPVDLLPGLRQHLLLLLLPLDSGELLHLGLDGVEQVDRVGDLTERLGLCL